MNTYDFSEKYTPNYDDLNDFEELYYDPEETSIIENYASLPGDEWE